MFFCCCLSREIEPNYEIPLDRPRIEPPLPNRSVVNSNNPINIHHLDINPPTEILSHPINELKSQQINSLTNRLFSPSFDFDRPGHRTPSSLLSLLSDQSSSTSIDSSSITDVEDEEPLISDSPLESRLGLDHESVGLELKEDVCRINQFKVKVGLPMIDTKAYSSSSDEPLMPYRELLTVPANTPTYRHEFNVREVAEPLFMSFPEAAEKLSPFLSPDHKFFPVGCSLIPKGTKITYFTFTVRARRLMDYLLEVEVSLKEVRKEIIDLFNEYLSLKKPMLSPCMNTTYGIIGRLSKAHLWVVCALGIDLISEDQTQRLRFKNLESFIEKVNQLSLKSLQNENLSIAKYPYANQKIKGEIKKKLRDHIQFQVVRPPRLKWTLFQRQIQQIINRSNHLCKVGAENKSMAKI